MGKKGFKSDMVLNTVQSSIVVAFYMHELKVFANFGTYFAQSDTDDTMYLVLVTD